MTKILFIYGYGGSPKSKFCKLIREALPKEEFEVVCYTYPQEDCALARNFLQVVIEREQIDLVMGTSLGGFITLSLATDLPKIVLNPCMIPSVELPLLHPRQDHPDDVLPSAELISTYQPFEEMVNSGSDNHSRRVIGLFANGDELLGTKYKLPFIEAYGEARSMPGSHHGNSEAIPVIVKAVLDISRSSK